MKKNEKTTLDHVSSSGDVLTGIYTLGVLSPNVIDALEVKDAVLVVVIDKKNRKHLRVSFPTQTLMSEDHPRGRTDLPRVECDKSGCWWVTHCVKGAGELPKVVKQCLGGGKGCPPYPQNMIDLHEPC